MRQNKTSTKSRTRSRTRGDHAKASAGAADRRNTKEHTADVETTDGLRIFLNQAGKFPLLTASEVVVDADGPEIAVGVDGEAIVLPTPVRCTALPKALRVRVPRNRPGVLPPKPVMDWVRLRHLAAGRG